MEGSMTEQDSINRLRAIVASLCESFQAEVDRLKAIIDRFPKTMDGVVITPGMKVYDVQPGGYIQGVDVKYFEAQTDASIPEPVYYLPGCYSTHEAAEAALESKKG
jgi:hypothetical protein